jgi:hypothetical protein
VCGHMSAMRVTRQSDYIVLAGRPTRLQAVSTAVRKFGTSDRCRSPFLRGTTSSLSNARTIFRCLKLDL